MFSKTSIGFLPKNPNFNYIFKVDLLLNNNFLADISNGATIFLDINKTYGSINPSRIGKIINILEFGVKNIFNGLYINGPSSIINSKWTFNWFEIKTGVKQRGCSFRNAL